MAQINFAIASLNQTPLDWDNNLENIGKALGEAKSSGAEFLVLPELALTGYGCQDLFLSNWLYISCEKEVQNLIPRTDGITLAFGLPILVNNERYNGVIVIRDKKILGITLKHHLADDGVHYEPRWFKSWPQGTSQTITYAGQTCEVGDLIYEQNGVKIGIEICRDAWKGEQRTAHSLIKRGCEVILNPSASHFAFGKTMIREELGLSLTKQYNCSFLLVNLLGNEAGRMIFDGDLQFHQNGRLKYKAERLSFKKVDCHLVTVDTKDPSKSSEYKPTDWFFKNEEFTIASTLALFDYVRKTKSRGFVLSLSGGADSSLCALLVAHTIRRMMRHYAMDDIAHMFDFKVPEGSKNWPEFKKRNYVTEKLLTCVYQSTENSSSETYESARKLANSLGAEFFLWSVDEEIESVIEKAEFVLGRKLTWEKDDITLQNIQSRMRAPGVWVLANTLKKLLITTSNRSEASVGYATMDGDTAGSLSPIAGVDKHFVRRYLLWAEEELGYEGLQDVNNLDPSAELRPHKEKQSDEGDLMPYFILNKIEQKAIGEWKSPIEVFDELCEEIPWPHGKIKTYIAKFFRLWSYNQWKRERYAPSFHFDDYNVDPKTWCRFPIISGGFSREIDELIKY